MIPPSGQILYVRVKIEPPGLHRGHVTYRIHLAMT